MSATRTAIVTGSARGIGRAIAHRLATDGHHVAVLDLDESACQEVADEITEGGGTDVAAMIDALEGATFDSVKGEVEIRAGDHAVIQPMFQAKLVAGADGTFTPELVETVDAETVAPPAAG